MSTAVVMTSSLRAAGLAAVALATVLVTGGCAVGESTPSGASGTTATTMTPDERLGSVRDGIRALLTEMTPAKRQELCTAWRKDPKPVLEAFIRPLTASGVDPSLAGVAFAQEMSGACK